MSRGKRNSDLWRSFQLWSNEHHSHWHQQLNFMTIAILSIMFHHHEAHICLLALRACVYPINLKHFQAFSVFSVHFPFNTSSSRHNIPKLHGECQQHKFKRHSSACEITIIVVCGQGILDSMWYFSDWVIKNIQNKINKTNCLN